MYIQYILTGATVDGAQLTGNGMVLGAFAAHIWNNPIYSRTRVCEGIQRVALILNAFKYVHALRTERANRCIYYIVHRFVPCYQWWPAVLPLHGCNFLWWRFKVRINFWWKRRKSKTTTSMSKRCRWRRHAALWMRYAWAGSRPEVYWTIYLRVKRIHSVLGSVYRPAI